MQQKKHKLTNSPKSLQSNPSLKKPVDTAIFGMIPESDPDLITYLTELLRTNKPDQHNKSFWLCTPKNPDKTEERSPIQR